MDWSDEDCCWLCADARGAVTNTIVMAAANDNQIRKPGRGARLILKLDVTPRRVMPTPFYLKNTELKFDP